VNYLLAPPTGIFCSMVAFFAGVALWVWKDPGGNELALGPEPGAPIGAPPLPPEQTVQN
jgi:hypothetical protein